MKDKYAREQIENLDKVIEQMLAREAKQAAVLVRLAEFVRDLLPKGVTK